MFEDGTVSCHNSLMNSATVPLTIYQIKRTEIMISSQGAQYVQNGHRYPEEFLIDNFSSDSGGLFSPSDFTCDKNNVLFTDSWYGMTKLHQECQKTTHAHTT